MVDKEKFEEEALAEFLEVTGIPKEKVDQYCRVNRIEFHDCGEIHWLKNPGLAVIFNSRSSDGFLPVLYFPNKHSEPVLSHSETSGLIYVYFGGEKYEITKYAIEAVEAIKESVLNKIRSEIIDTGAYEQEIHGKTEFLEGINYCLGVIDKHKGIKEVEDGTNDD